MNDRFSEQVYQYVSNIPPGKVVSYGTVAKALGRPQAARAVGTILKRNQNPFYKVRPGVIKTLHHDEAVPCHRVVRADLKLGGYNGGYIAKKKLLQQEGVKIVKGKVAPEHMHVPTRPVPAKVQNPLA